MKVAANSYSACALLATGEAKCWGFNGDGELGNHSTKESNVPVKVHLI